MARGLRKVTRSYPSTVVEELHTVEAQLGGRQAVVGLLALAPLTPTLRYILGMLGEPRFASQSLAEICSTGNILPGELLQHLASAALLRGKTIAAQRIGMAVPAVVEDVLKRATPYEEACSGCQGIGTRVADPTPDTPNPAPVACETCGGTGRLIYQPDLEVQKLALDLAQLLPRSGGMQIQNIASGGSGHQQQQTGGFGVFAQISALSDRILYGSGDKATTELDDEALPGEIVPPEGAPGV